MDYMGNILVMGATFKEHLQNLEQVFRCLREANLRLKPSKCHMAKKEVEYLGYVVSEQGISADPKKVLAVKSFPTPVDLKHLRSFLGLASYYRTFIPNVLKVANPLFALTRKGVQFLWSSPCQEAFERLKTLLSEAPLLALPNFDRDFVLETDVSGVGIGAVLAQVQEDGTKRPIAYARRTLQKYECNYGITELEAIGVVWSVKHFRPYLHGHCCNTDHEPLKALLNAPHPSAKLARWGMALQELDLHIHYRPGKRNANPDALSRTLNESVSLAEPSEPLVVLAALQPGEDLSKGGDDCLEKRQRQDPELTMITEYLQDGIVPKDYKKARAHPNSVPV